MHRLGSLGGDAFHHEDGFGQRARRSDLPALIKESFREVCADAVFSTPQHPGDVRSVLGDGEWASVLRGGDPIALDSEIDNLLRLRSLPVRLSRRFGRIAVS